ncbi:hypothetical protein DYQ86_19855 [Acidobacteria bacterium AB60]|nr:hypothetical protein DYQ86_19855 [Acidobacteria bacterium AB60]
MTDWTKVVVQPLGLAGFALFLVFGLVARLKRGASRRWLSPVAIAMACLALVGGLALAWVNATKSASPTVHSIQTSGDASPVFVGTGAVTYSADVNSSKKTPDPSAAPAKPVPPPPASGGK